MNNLPKCTALLANKDRNGRDRYCSYNACMKVVFDTRDNERIEENCCMVHLRFKCIAAGRAGHRITVYKKTAEQGFEYYELYPLNEIAGLEEVYDVPNPKPRETAAQRLARMRAIAHRARPPNNHVVNRARPPNNQVVNRGRPPNNQVVNAVNLNIGNPDPSPPPPPVQEHVRHDALRHDALRQPPPQVPLNLPAVLDRDKAHPCCVCYDDTKQIFCSTSRHTMCETCFEHHISAECDRTEFDGTIKCPLQRMNECDCHGFKVTFIAKHVNEEVFTEYDRRRYQVKEKEVIRHIREEEDQKQKTLSSEDKEIRHILDNILTLKCPHCQSAYFDFDGCLSLQCKNCKKYFCAKCHEKQKSSKWSHAHVSACKMGGYTGLFHKRDLVQKIQNHMRVRNLKDYIDRNPDKKHLIHKLRKELNDLNITVS